MSGMFELYGVLQRLRTPRHEHIYSQKIRDSLVRSDQIPKEKADLRKVIGSARVVLCTLSMLSNQRLEDSGFFDLVPVRKLVVDEASQVNIGEFMVCISHSS